MSSDNIKFDVVEGEEDDLGISAPSVDDLQIPSSSSILETRTEDVPFEEKIRRYVAQNKPKLYILTPCYGSQCYVNYVTCLMNTIGLFSRYGFPLQIEFCRNDSLVSRARNNLVARAMSDPETTHIFFIDSDITWNPLDIFKLILADKSLVGGVYPLKNYQWNKLVKDPQNPFNTNIVQSLLTKKKQSQLAAMISDEDMVQHNLLSYNINYLQNYLTIDNNLAQVKHLATGFMMIQRNTLEKMMKAFPSTKYVDDVHFLKEHENQYAYALFDCGVENGHYLSEDWLFCHRWTKMGGSIWIDVSINLTHTGIEDYKGSYIASIV